MRYLTPLFLLITVSTQAALSVGVQAWDATCGNPSGKAMATPSGGLAPYTYSWSNGATDATITDLAPGTYTVTVTDANSDQAQADAVINNLDNLGFYGEEMFGLGGVTPCLGECNGGFRFYMPWIGQEPISVLPDAPMTLDFTNQDMQSMWTARQFLGACEGQVVTLNIQDFYGCPGQAQITVPQAVVPEISIVSTTGSCTGGTGGTVTVQVIMPTEAIAYEPWWELVARDDQGNLSAGTMADFQQATAEYTLFGLHPGNWTAVIHKSSSLGSETDCEYTTPFTVADVGPACGELSGAIHHESNQNCIQDNGEVGVAYRMLEFQPGPFYAITGGNGAYLVDLPYGNYSMTQLGAGVEQLCPPSSPIVFTMNPGQSVINIADSILTPFDLWTSVCNTPARPGFQFTYHLHVFNNSAYPGEATTVDFTYDPVFSYVSSSTSPSVSTPGVLQFQLPDMVPFGHANITVTLQVPPDVGLIGTQHTATLTASSALAEDNTNNTTTDALTVTGSYDPNDKEARTSSGLSDAEYLIGSDEWIDYTIRFQNTGTDTAFTVVVMDTLSAHLDITTLQILGASHDFVPEIRNGNLLKFTFEDILLPDSNVNELASHGYVAFRIRPHEAVDQLISNAADIYFDFNPPVRTNTSELWMTVILGMNERTSEGVQFYPVPTDDLLNIRMPAGQAVDRITIRANDGRVLIVQQGAASLDVSTLTPGLYSVQVNSVDGRWQVLRFLKS